jgi:hypothetical protein
MKKIIFLIVVLSSTFTAQAQFNINFDSFTLGDLSPQSTHVILWPAATATDPQVSDEQAYSTPHSMKIRANGGGIADDVLFQLGNKNTGVWIVSWWMYVPSTNNGYFNIQEHETANPTQWNGEFFVDITSTGGSAGEVTHDQTSSSVAYPNDTWFQIVISVDIDIDEINVTVNGNSLLQDAVYEDTSGLPANQLGAIDFYSSDADTTFYIDDFALIEGCNIPTNVTIDTFTDTSASISWTASNETNGYAWVLMALGDDPETGTPIQSGTTTTGTTSVVLNNLTPDTSYDFYVLSDCGTIGQSRYGDMLSFTTALACNITGSVTTYPYIEDFEASSPSIGCWTQIQEVGTADWIFAEGAIGGGITTANSGVQNMRFVSENDIGSPITKLVSPTFDLTALPNPELSFYYAQEDWLGGQNELKIYYRESDADAWVEIAHYTTNVATWTQETLSLPNPTATYQIAFEGINNFGYANVLDDIVVQEGLSVASSKHESFNFYPNPVKDKLFINAVQTDIETINLYNITGKKVLSKSFGQEESILEMTQLQPGIYLMEVQTKGKRDMVKIIKQ